QKVDDRPFGGGPGMVLQVQPVVDCVEHVQKLEKTPGQVILLTPQGKPFDQPTVEQLADQPRQILLCGRYEGFDQRVIDLLDPLEISIGDYILNGGEVAAMVVIDAVTRLLPGVLGDERSAVEDSFSTGNRILEGPQYTRPRQYRGHDVPDVLLSGDHEAIARWRKEQGKKKTQQQRADLINEDSRFEHDSDDS
ncbi:MAG: tRNA (guanosine(37)-N1)-methyltransferase TrmD, partial [Pirellulaceae bacterium]